MLDMNLFAPSWRESLLVLSKPHVSQPSSLLMLLMSAGMKNLHLPSFLSSHALWTRFHGSNSSLLVAQNQGSALDFGWLLFALLQRCSSCMMLNVPLVDKDIKVFFKTQLTEISKTRSDCDLLEDWPSSHDIDTLCEKAAGLFIHASTVVKFIASQHHLPTKRLTLIISLPQSTTHEGKSGIDFLYTKVLEQVFSNVGLDEQELYSQFRSVVGSVSLVHNPLSMKTLSTLLGIPDISITLRSLHSVLLFPNNPADPIRIFHKSFPDFLMDPG